VERLVLTKISGTKKLDSTKPSTLCGVLIRPITMGGNLAIIRNVVCLSKKRRKRVKKGDAIKISSDLRGWTKNTNLASTPYNHLISHEGKWGIGKK
jgi:hypothetical protein